MRQGKKIPAATWEKFLELLSEQTTSVISTCRALGIEARSYYYERSRNKEFGDAVDAIFDSIRRPYAEDALFALISEKNLGAIKFYLSQRGGKRWNDAKILPMVVQYEINNPPPEKDFVQRIPTLKDMLCADAYKLGKSMDIDNLPDTVIIDISSIKSTVQNPFYRKRLLEEEKMYDKDEDD